MADELREMVLAPPLALAKKEGPKAPVSVFEKIMDGYRAARLQREYPLNRLLSDLIATAEEEKPKFSPNLQKIIAAGGVSDSEARYAHHVIKGFSEQLQNLMTRMGEGLVTREAKILWAQLNQRISVGLYHSLKEDASDTQEADSFVELLTAFTAPGIRGRDLFRGFLSGVRSQAGLMHLLSQRGYSVIPLDWKNRAEIEEFDLKGIDFVAVDSVGVTYLIDAKGRSHREMRWSFETNQVVSIIPSAPEGRPLAEVKPALEKKLEKAIAQKVLPDRKALVMGRYRKLIVTIPSSGDFLGEYGMITDDRIQKEVLRGLEKHH